MKQKLAILVPYRDRRKELDIFMPHMDAFLKNKNIDYKIFVIEQNDDRPFNRGKLLNIGFDLFKNDYDYFCFHDVDLLPINQSCDYSYVEYPTHMAVDVDVYDGKIPFPEYIGGVLLFNREDFIKINGYSNEYWGWGMEDLDLLYRMRKHGLNLATFYEYGKVTEDTRYFIDEVKLVDSVNKRKLHCIEFDGESTYIQLPVSSNPENDVVKTLDDITSDSFSIYTMVKPYEIPELNKHFFIFSRPGHHLGLEYIYPGYFRSIIWDEDNKPYSVRAKREPNKWYNLIMRVDNVKKKLSLIINGVSIEDRENKCLFDDKKLKDYSGEMFYIGSAFPREMVFNGLISDTAIFDYALSDKECLSIYENGILDKDGFSNANELPISYWSFKNGYRNIIFDNINRSPNNIRLKNVDIKKCKKESEVETATKIELPFRRYGIYESVESYKYKVEDTETGTEIEIPNRRTGIYKTLNYNKNDNIVETMRRGEFGDIMDPDIEENKDIFFEEVRTGKLDTDSIGLNSLKYKVTNDFDFLEKHQWISVVT
jgi:hypothetical protein